MELEGDGAGELPSTVTVPASMVAGQERQKRKMRESHFHKVFLAMKNEALQCLAQTLTKSSSASEDRLAHSDTCDFVRVATFLIDERACNE